MHRAVLAQNRITSYNVCYTKLLRGEIDRIKKDGVSEAELKRTRAQLIASQVYKLDSMFGQAMEIGQAEAVGLSWKDVDTMRERLQAVSAADVQAVANKYFSDDAVTVVITSYSIHYTKLYDALSTLLGSKRGSSFWYQGVLSAAKRK